MLVNASTWGLMLTGRVVALDRNEVGEARSWYARLVGKLGEPVARAALKQAMRILGHQFVMGRDIESALTRAAGKEERDYRYSFDMLGEAALTRADAERYREKYAAAIAAVGKAVETRESITARHSISIKLSALHPRYEFAQAARVMAELYPGHRDAGAAGARCRHRRHARCRGGRTPRVVAVAGRPAARKRRDARLCGLRARRAGLPEARLRHASNG